MSAFVEKLPSAPMLQMLHALRGQYPPLTAEEESALILRWQGDRERLNELLVLHNASLLTGWAKGYAMRYRDMDVDDMIQCGFIGLWRAAEKFEPERGLRFGTFAGYHAQAAMGYATRLRGYHVDRRSVSLNYRLDSKDGEEKQELIDVVQGRIVAECKETSLAEWLETRDFGDFEAKFFAGLRRTCMGDREASALYRHAKGETNAEIAKSLGRTPERARQVVEAARKKARAYLKWHARLGVVNWDRLYVGRAPNNAPDTGRRIYSAYMAGWVAWERYKLGIKKAAPIAVREEKGPVLTSEGFTTKRFVVKGRKFTFKDGKWVPAPKEEDYGHAADT